MSAFVLEENGFNQLASELFAHATNQHSSLQWIVARTIGAERSDYEQAEQAARSFAQQLFAANIRAVNQRYQDSEPVPILRFTEASGLPKWSNAALLKSLECLSYQMAEGDVPESEIYKTLEELIGGIARAIVGNSSEYKAAAWGWTEVKTDNVERLVFA